MASIDGLVSGINSSKIIEDLLAFQRQPIDRLQSDIKANTEKKVAVLSLTALLATFQGKVAGLSKPAGFSPIKVSSTNEQVLTASGSSELAPGSYRFKIRQLAQPEQYISSGFSSTTEPIGAGTLHLETGNGLIDRKSELDLLNGGNGVRRGSIRITNRTGVSVNIDLTTALTVDDVLERINNVSGLNVTARLASTGDDNPREGIVLTDGSGGIGTFKVEEINNGNTAKDLGILKSAASSTLQGSQIVKLGGALKLNALNDGLGIRLQSGDDLLITQHDGSQFRVDLGSATTLQEALNRINTAAGGLGVTVGISGSSLVATDASSGATAFSIADIGTGSAAQDLGLAGAESSGTITGGRILADFNSILLKTLQGGAGIASGSIRITNRAGVAETIDLSAAETISEAVDAINENAIGVSASYNATGNGLQLTDASGGTGAFKVEEVGGGATASGLGILQAAGVASDQINGADVNPQYISRNTLLSTLNGGKGVFAGKIRIIDGAGTPFEVDLSQEKTIGDVIDDINGKASSVLANVTASLNETGNGIRLVSAGGTGTLVVEEIGGGTTAKDLNIRGAAPADSPLEIDGAFGKSIELSATDSLEDLVTTINSLGLGVRASIIKDGSATTPFRLQIIGNDPGSLARVQAFTTGGTALTFSRNAAARDSILFYGSTENGSQPLVVRSVNNTFTDLVKGLTVIARGASDEVVEVAANRDVEGIRNTIEDAVDLYNKLVDGLQEFGRFDASTSSKGVLFGDAILRTIQRQINTAVTRPIQGLPQGKNLASSAGLRVQASGKLSFQTDKFDALYAADPSAIERIFTQKRPLNENTKLKDLDNGKGLKDIPDRDEFQITTRAGDVLKIDINGATTYKDLLDRINNAAGNAGKVTASTSADGFSLVLADSTAGSQTFRVEALNGSPVFRQLGLDKTPDVAGGDKITGRVIDLSDDPGIGLRLNEILEKFLNTESGSLTLRADFYQNKVEDIKKDIEHKEEILGLREATLRRSFAQLEILLGQNQNVAQRLAAGLGGAK